MQIEIDSNRNGRTEIENGVALILRRAFLSDLPLLLLIIVPSLVRLTMKRGH
jgi:hypothetical protein